jgi:uncharacterized protein (TIGR00288 family)
MEQRKKIALLIDYDNFNKEFYFPILFDELSEMGDIIVKYAFYSNLNDGTIKAKFIKYGIEPMSQIAYSSGKNAVDIRITIEAMELINRDYIDCICLATNDSDFTPLIKTLQKHNRFVIGAGDNKASESFKDACNSFISVEKISSGKSLSTAPAKSTDSLVETVNEIIETIKDEDDFADFASVMQKVYLKMKDFNPKNYGATNQKPILFFQKKLKDFYEFKKVGLASKIKVKK